MNLRQLTYVLTIAECGSISKAAEKLFISRSSLNESLLQLESEIGLPLFSRNKKSLVPTFAGNCYINSAKKMLETLTDLQNTLEEIKEDSTGQITLGTCRTIGEQILNAVIPIFHQKYPGYQFNLVVDEQIDKAVLKGVVPYAITGNGPALPLSEELESIPLSIHETVLVLPKQHPLSKDVDICSMPLPAINLKKLQNDHFILLNNGFNARKTANQYFESAGFSPKILIECNSGLMASRFVKAGLGPSILLDLLAVNDPRVTYYSLEPKAFWTSSICYRKDTVFTKADQYLISLMKEYAASGIHVIH